MIPYGRQDIRAVDVEAVVSVLHSDFLTQGAVVPSFEKAVADKVGAKYGIAANSATSALHLACLALGLGTGDTLWTTPNTFVASANCALYCGADVDFVDIDPLTYNMSVEALETKLRMASNSGRLPKVLVVVHFAGQPCDLASIKDLADEFGVKVIEDASHAIGALYEGEYVGSGRYSDVTVFSFHPVKIITTAEGGLAVTNDEHLADRMRLLGSHGVTRDERFMRNDSDGPWYYEQIDLGFNYRMTEIQAALGVSQLERLDEYVSKRHSLASRYDELLAGLPVVTPCRSGNTYSALHLYPIQVEGPERRRGIFERLRELGVGVNVHYKPVHTQPFYLQRGFSWGDFPESEAYYRRAISLPMYPTMSDGTVSTVVEALANALASA